MRVRAAVMIGLLAAAGWATGVEAADYARHGHRHVYRGGNFRGFIGTCVRTRVAAVGAAMPGQPLVIQYTDGVTQAYDAGLLGHTETRPGDPIQLCLVAFTRDCGGDLDEDLEPGRTYATGNLRTGAAWTLPDIRSSCARR